MEIEQAQKDVRETFLGGFAGQLVSAVLWAGSAAVCTWHSLRWGGVFLLLGGVFIFPMTQLLLRSMGHAYALPSGHPMNALAVQVAFALPLGFPVVLELAMLRPGCFYPALMVLVGAHYLPFIFLYGMWQFGALAGVLIGAGVWIGMRVPAPVSLGAWVTAGVLLVFAFVGRHAARRESAEAASSTRTHG